MSGIRGGWAAAAIEAWFDGAGGRRCPARTKWIESWVDCGLDPGDRSINGCDPSARARAPHEWSHDDKLRETVRTVGLDRIFETEFVSFGATAVILDAEHVDGGVEAICVA